MRKQNRIFKMMFLTLVALFTIVLVSCGNGNGKIDPPEIATIQEVLETGEDGKTVLVKGTVYAEVSNGYYISDSDLGKIFIEKGTFNSSVGKEIEVEGTLLTFSNRKHILATKLTEVGTGTLPTPNDMSIDNILGLNPSNKTGTWFQYAKVTGQIQYNSITDLLLLIADDGTEIQFTSDSNVDVLKARQDVRVELPVITEYVNLGGQWRLLFTGQAADIVDKPFNNAEIETLIVQTAAQYFDKDIFGSLQLPAFINGYPSITIEWTSNDASIEILALTSGDDVYRTNIELVDKDVDVTLTATVDFNNNKVVKEFNVTVKELVKMGVKDAIASEQALVLVEGVVVGYAATQSASAKSLIVQDINDASVVITAEYSSSKFTELENLDAQIGDIVLFVAELNLSGRPTLHPLESSIDGKVDNFTYDFDKATELSGTSWSAWPGHNSFVKLVNPYMRYSTSSAPGETNWIRFGGSADTITQTYGPTSAHNYAFLLRPFDRVVGKEMRENFFEVPLLGETPVLFEGEIYAYITYQSATYIQFVIVNADHVIPAKNTQVLYDLKTDLETSIESGNLNLMTTHDNADAAITYTSSNLSVISNTGVVTYPEYDTVVTMTAKYTVDGKDYEYAYNVIVFGSIKVVVQVEDVFNASNGDIVYLEGVVLSTTHSTSGAVTGHMVQDKVTGKIVIVTGLGGDLGAVEIGQLIEFQGVVNIDEDETSNEAGRLTVVAQSNLVILDADFGIQNYKGNNNVITIASQQDMLDTFVKSDLVYGGVYHFTGEYFVIASTQPDFVEVTNYRVHMNDAAGGATDIRYDGRQISLQSVMNEATIGNRWYTDVWGIDENNFPPALAVEYPGFKYSGGFYAVLSFSTGSYLHLQMVDIDDFYENEEAVVLDYLESQIPATLPTGNIVLPTAHDLVTGNIVWSSNKPAVINAEGVVTYGAEDELVILTATYTINGVEIVESFDVLVLAEVNEASTVKAVVESANPGDIVRVGGVIAGFHWNGSSTLGNLTHGIVIADLTGNDLLYVNGLHDNFGSTRATYLVGDHTLAVGDEVEFFAEFSVNDADGFVNRNELLIQSVELADFEIISSGKTIEWDLTQAIEITNGDELAVLAEELQYGKVIKMTGPFAFRSSLSSYGTGANFVPSYKWNATADFNQDVTWGDRPQRFSIRFDGNEPNLGANWWEEALNVNADNFSGTAAAGHLYDADSTIYFYIGSALPRATSNFGYIQLIILDPSWINVNRIL